MLQINGIMQRMAVQSDARDGTMGARVALLLTLPAVDIQQGKPQLRAPLYPPGLYFFFFSPMPSHKHGLLEPVL